ncbi:hypothetical protein LDENG_00213050, partial [Lucifuga dentata]
MDRADRDKDTTVLKNQPYDESLEVLDSEEVASIYSPTPHHLTQPQANRKGRDLMATNSSSEEFEEEEED